MSKYTPDQEPSNADRLEKIVWDMDGPLGHIGRDRAEVIAKWLDDAGVTAPGGDE